MTTQEQLRAQASYREIDTLAYALTPDSRYPGVTRWVEAHAKDTMHAIGYVLADLMLHADVYVWRVDDYTIRAYQQPPNGRDIQPKWIQIASDDLAVRRTYGHAYIGPRKWYGNESDPEIVEQWIRCEVAAALHPDIAGWCGSCNGALYHDDPIVDSDGECAHCGAAVMVCEADCLEIGGGDVCFHHGAPMVPMVLWREHNENHNDAMDAYLAGNDHAQTVARLAARPDGIWHFPSGRLAGTEAVNA